MKVLVTGSASGQLFSELNRSVPESVEIVSSEPRLDITCQQDVDAALTKLRPDVVINAAAYTAVDKAETEQELAHRVNGEAVGFLCTACTKIDARLIHISTDFVFDGLSGSPYSEDAATSPLSVYGASKLEGEQQITQKMPDTGLIIRTSWVYSATGANFVKTMLRLMAERDELGVIADQVGSPTWAAGLAGAVWRSVELALSGTLHWTDAGVASWYDFAVAIHEEGTAAGLLNKPVAILPLRSDQYPVPATRPQYSVLEKSRSWEQLGMQSPHWRSQLRNMLKELK